MKKDDRYLIRLANTQGFVPRNHAELLQGVRRLSAQGQSVMNLRVTPVALEFDLFLPAGQPVSDALLAAWSTIGKVVTCRLLQDPTGPLDKRMAVLQSRELFNEHRFWEVHEVLEMIWKAASGDEKKLVQGLILTAAALVHVQKNELQIVPAMLADALERLEGQPSMYHGWNLEDLRAWLKAARDLAAPNTPVPLQV